MTHIRMVGRAAVALFLGVSLALAAAPAEAGKRGRRGKRAAKKAEEAKKQAAMRRAEALFGEGAALFKAKRYRQAIVKFEAAYAAYPEPNLLYNLGRCYEAIGQLKRAKVFFERFVKDPAANPAVRKKAETHLQMLRSIEAQVGKAQEPTSAPAAPPPPAATRPASRPAPPPPPPRGFARIGKWLFAGLGLVAAGVGTAMFIAGAGDHGDLQDARDEAGNGGVAGLTQREASQLSDDGKLKKTVGIIGWAAAAACLAGSAVFWALDGGTKERASRQTAFAPWVGSGSAGAVLVGTF